jgi:hypothetical protein
MESSSILLVSQDKFRFSFSVVLNVHGRGDLTEDIGNSSSEIKACHRVCKGRVTALTESLNRSETCSRTWREYLVSNKDHLDPDRRARRMGYRRHTSATLHASVSLVSSSFAPVDLLHVVYMQIAGPQLWNAVDSWIHFTCAWQLDSWLESCCWTSRITQDETIALLSEVTTSLCRRMCSLVYARSASDTASPLGSIIMQVCMLAVTLICNVNQSDHRKPSKPVSLIDVSTCRMLQQGGK